MCLRSHLFSHKHTQFLDMCLHVHCEKWNFIKKGVFFPHKNICRNIRVFMLWFIAPNNIYLRCTSTHTEPCTVGKVKCKQQFFLSIIRVASHKGNDLNKGCTFPIIYSHLVASLSLSLYARRWRWEWEKKELNSMS